ncbi:MAG TPA: hypothetical protein VE027_00915 [Acidimicrobiia bacterium]|jgi:hypothetical protein|nr:hypothetical protein [Acidimicrobiia bacterium]HJQ90156.1 hypothetical protein [Acidimicrobiia bacterium]HYJ23539.1 hypothetical protein [Acidimicrobiia bacterium]
MREQSDTMQALGRAGRRAGYHLIQAVIEGLKAVEAVFEEVSKIGDKQDATTEEPPRTRIDIE